MIRRTARAVGVVATCLLAVVGVLVAPGGVLLAWLFLVPFVAVGSGVLSRVLDPDRPVSLRRRTAVTVASMVLVAVAAALGVVAGPAAVLVPALVAVVVLLRRRQRPWRWEELVAWLGAPLPAPPAPGTVAAAHPTSTGPEHADMPRPDRLPTLSTGEICAAWQRSFFLLADRPSGHRQWAIVRMRGDLLDELERRDPAGFARWLLTQPRPVSNPGRFLAADS